MASDNWIQEAVKQTSATPPKTNAAGTQPSGGDFDWMFGGPVESDPFEQAAAQSWREEAQTLSREQLSQLPWWYRAMFTGLSWMQPLQAPGDLARALVYDVTVRKPGEQSEFFRFLKQLPTYAPGGAAPKRIAPGEVLAENWFGAQGRTAGAIGLALEIALDPLVILDGLGTLVYRGGQKAALRAANKVMPEALRSINPTTTRMLIMELERMGDVDTVALLKRSLQQMDYGNKLRSPINWVPEPTRVAVGKVTMSILDKVPTPLVARMTVPGGATYERPLSLAEAITTKSTQAALHEGTPLGKAWKEYFGEADVTKLAQDIEEATPSALEQAMRRGEMARVRVMIAARNTHKYWREATGMTADVAKDDYTLWSKSVADWIDNLQAPEKLSRDVAEGFGIPKANELIDYSGFQNEIWKRMQVISKRIGVPAEDLFKAARDAAVENMQAAMEVGYVLADMQSYRKVLLQTAEALEKGDDEVGHVLWKAAYGKELTEEEDAILKAFRKQWEGTASAIAQVDPLDYIRGLTDGYYRRFLGIYSAEPEMLMKMARDLRGGTRWMPAREIGAEKFISELERLAGKDIADKVAGFALVYGDGPVTADMIAKYTGVKPEVLLEAARNANISDLSPKMRKLIEDALAEGRQRGLRPAFTLQGRRLFKERVLPDEAVDAWLPLAKLEERAASLGYAAGRAIQGSEVIRATYTTLAKQGLVADSAEALSDAGVKLVFKLPDSPALGPLSGKYIPRQIAETFLRSVETGDPGLYARLLNNLRVAWLSGPGTISRNITGGITMMHAAGISPQEMAENAKVTYEALRELYLTGNAKKIGPGHELLKLFGEGELAGEASDFISRGLADLFASAKVKPTDRWLEQLKGYSKRVADIATGRPLFDMFQQSEDYMRLMTFFIVRKRLLNRGFSMREAGIQAAQIANNILFDYSSQPEMVRVLKKTGLMLFPAFPVFNLGRTAKLAVSRPASLAALNDIQQASLGFLDEDERERASRIIYSSWISDEGPLLLPGPEPGSFITVPMRQLFPQLAAGDIVTMATSDPLRAGVMAPLIEAYTAFQKEGEAIWSGKYGERVYDPLLDTTPGARAASTARFLARQYAPGVWRWAGDSVNNLYKYYRSSNAELISQVFADRYGDGVGRTIAKTFGVNYRKVYGGAQDVENIQRIEAEFRDNMRKARARLRRAAAAGDQAGIREAREALLNSVRIYRAEMCKYMGGVLTDEGCKQ